MPIKEVIAAYMQSVYLDVFLHVLSLLFPLVTPYYLWPVAISQGCLQSEILQPLNLRNCYPRLLRMEEAREVLDHFGIFLETYLQMLGHFDKLTYYRLYCYLCITIHLGRSAFHTAAVA